MEKGKSVDLNRAWEALLEIAGRREGVKIRLNRVDKREQVKAGQPGKEGKGCS